MVAHLMWKKLRVTQISNSYTYVCTYRGRHPYVIVSEHELFPMCDIQPEVEPLSGVKDHSFKWVIVKWGMITKCDPGPNVSNPLSLLVHSKHLNYIILLAYTFPKC